MKVNVRPITPADEGAYATILERTSDEDRYYRFFRAVDVFAPSDIRRFVEARPDMIGLIAEDSERAPEPLGAAHAALLEDGSAELAIVVADNARERGVGTTLLTTLIATLRRLGYDRIVAHSLQDNVGFARLARRIGMRIEGAVGSDVRWSLEGSGTLA